MVLGTQGKRLARPALSRMSVKRRETDDVSQICSWNRNRGSRQGQPNEKAKQVNSWSVIAEHHTHHSLKHLCTGERRFMVQLAKAHRM